MKFRKINYLTIIFTLLVMLCFSISAFAETITINSQNITVETKDTPTATTLVDKRGLFSDEQIQQIEDYGRKLSVYDIGLYVEMIEPSKCTQRYTNQLAEEKFTDVMNDRKNSMIIVFSFYEDAGGYYAVHYDVQGDLSERKISKIIQGTYHDYKTDSEWIVGSFGQVIDYLCEVEYNLINADQIAAEAEQQRIAKEAKQKQNIKLFLEVFRLILELGLILIAIFLIYSKGREETEYEEKISNLSNNIDKLQNIINHKENVINKITTQRDILNKWQVNAREVNSSIDEDIKQHLAKLKAEAFDKKYFCAENFKDLDSLVKDYNKLSDTEKTYVGIDVKKAKAKYDKLLKSKVEEATNVIQETCDLCEGNRHYRSQLSDTMDYYNGLPSSIRLLIAASLIQTLSNKHESACSDYRHNQSSYNSSVNHSSYSSNTFSSGGFHSGTFGGGFHGGH